MAPDFKTLKTSPASSLVRPCSAMIESMSYDAMAKVTPVRQTWTAKNLWVENPASLKSEFYVFFGEMSVSKTITPAKSKFYVFYGEMLHIYPRNHAHIMIFYAIFFLPNTLQPSRAYFLTPARYICFPRSISIQQTTSPIIEISAVPQVFKWTLHPKPVVGHIESWNDPWMGEKYA